MMGPLKREDRKVTWDGSRDPLTLEPIRVFESLCCRCGERTKTPVGQVIDAEVAMWRGRYERMYGELNDLLKQCLETFGTTPMREWMAAHLEQLRDRKPWESTGDEWKP